MRVEAQTTGGPSPSSPARASRRRATSTRRSQGRGQGGHRAASNGSANKMPTVAATRAEPEAGGCARGTGVTRWVKRRPSRASRNRYPSPKEACTKACEQNCKEASVAATAVSSQGSARSPPQNMRVCRRLLEGVEGRMPSAGVNLLAACMRSTHSHVSFSVFPERHSGRCPLFRTENVKGRLWSLTHCTVAPLRFTTSRGFASCCER
mmetsp:Transcript_76760/g.228827  ORF Transcript_76760/g.228827 Transcript_76760/m.228827 type:complete len:208 (-) Transcript_76760:370-993(-)